jgi:hypothetical protein
MKLTKSKIAMLALLGVAVVGLLVDRVFLTSSTTAPQAANASNREPALPVPLTVVTPTMSVSSTSTAHIAARLRHAGEKTSMDPAALKDAFVPAESWLAKPEQGTPVALTTTPVVDSGDRFVRDHKLTSVLIDAGGGIAVVNGKVLRVGQEIDGYRLVRLAPGTAEFESGPGGSRIQLQTVQPTP